MKWSLNVFKWRPPDFGVVDGAVDMYSPDLRIRSEFAFTETLTKAKANPGNEEHDQVNNNLRLTDRRGIVAPLVTCWMDKLNQHKDITEYWQGTLAYMKSIPRLDSQHNIQVEYYLKQL